VEDMDTAVCEKSHSAEVFCAPKFPSSTRRKCTLVRLSKLQDHVVPRSHGVFVARDGDKMHWAMILDRVDELPKLDWSHLTNRVSLFLSLS